MSIRELPARPSALWLYVVLAVAALAIISFGLAFGDLRRLASSDEASFARDAAVARDLDAAREAVAAIGPASLEAADGDSEALQAAIVALVDATSRLIEREGASSGGPGGAADTDRLSVVSGELVDAARATSDGLASEGELLAATVATLDALEALDGPGTPGANAAISLNDDDVWLALGGAVFLAGMVVLIAGLYSVQRRRFDVARRMALDTEQRLVNLTDDLTYMVYETDRLGRFVWVSPSCKDLLGWPADQLIGRRVREFVAYGDEPTAPNWRPRMAGIEAGEYHWRHRDGRTRRLEVLIQPRPGRDRRAVRGVVREVGDRLAAERALRENQLAFVEMLQAAQNGFVIVSATGDVLLFNVALSEMLGYPPDELQNLALADLVPHDEVNAVLELVRGRIEGAEPNSIRYEGSSLRRDGERRDVEMSISPYRMGTDVQSALIEINDITERNQATERIQHMANFDQLTGLPNRYRLSRDLAEALGEAEQRSERRAVMVVDLDRFKLVNDSLGHAAGDELLRQVASRLQAAISDNHTLGRLGGDEFLLVTPPLEDTDDAASTARAIVGALAAPFHLQRREFHVNASLGIGIFPDDGRDGPTLIQRADSAMYRAKEVGGAGYQFASSMITDALQGRLALEEGLRGAVERGEFVVFYQPEVDVETGSIRSMEALLRWNHPQRGLIPPSVIIPLLEETGLISQVGEWVLRTACEESRRWQIDGLPPIVMSVNLSPKQLANPALLECVRGVLEETGLEPHHLELEVTESAALTDLEDSIRMLRELRDLGVRTAIDDFGTGHSSLVRLKQLPVTALKIDRSFVEGIVNGDEDATIVGGVIALGHALGLTVIAEGVETAAQRSALKALGCDVLQGFLFAQPLPPEASRELLAQFRDAA